MTAAERLPLSPRLLETGVVAILRGGSGEHLQGACTTLIDSGVVCLEITTNTAGCWDAVPRLARTYGSDIELGMGTVLSPAQVRRAADAGATFVVAPNVDLEVGAAAAELGLRWYPGAATPTEIVCAWDAGATAVKVFPASDLGGPRYLKSVAAPLDFIPLLPTGGVGVDSIASYLRAGAISVGVGSPLMGDTLTSGDLDGLGDRARRVLAATADGRGASE